MTEFATIAAGIPFNRALDGHPGVFESVADELRPELLQPFIDALSNLISITHELQLRDPVAYMTFKAPDPPLPVDEVVIQTILTASCEKNDATCRQLLASLVLGELFTLHSLTHRLRFACAERIRRGRCRTHASSLSFGP
jgi:hypothetical protein